MNHAEAVTVFGIKVEFLLQAPETGDAYSLYRLTVQPGDGTPPHIHRKDDEAFYVLDGEFECGRGNDQVRVGKGSVIFLPRKQPHFFRNVGTVAGHLLAINSPGGHERFFRDACQLGSTPELGEIISVCDRHGMDLVFQ